MLRPAMWWLLFLLISLTVWAIVIIAVVR